MVDAVNGANIIYNAAEVNEPSDPQDRNNQPPLQLPVAPNNSKAHGYGQQVRNRRGKNKSMANANNGAAANDPDMDEIAAS